MHLTKQHRTTTFLYKPTKPHMQNCLPVTTTSVRYDIKKKNRSIYFSF